MTSIEHHIESNETRRYSPARRQYESPQRPVPHESIARLRAFSMLLCMDVTLADELVTVTLVRAGVAVNPAGIGNNLSIWLIKRLRSYYYREFTRRALAMPPQAATREQADILSALAKLRPEQREALVLVEAIRFSLGEAGRICRQPPGRFRALLEGARTDLARHLEGRRSQRSNQDGVTFPFVVPA